MKKLIASLILFAISLQGAVKDIRVPQIVSGTTFTNVVVSPTASSIQIYDPSKVPGTLALDTDLNAFLTAGTLASLNTALGVTLSTFDGSALNASNLSSGTIPDARFPATLPALSGVNLTALNASNLSSGTIPDARFPATLPALSGVNLTALNASNLGSGTVPDARFPATLPAISGANLTSVIAATNANLTGIVTSVGNATAIANGAIPIAKLASSAITINGSSISLGGSISNLQTTNGTLALAGFSVITGVIDNANIANTTITLGTTPIALGDTTTVLDGLTSVTSNNFIGALTGLASSATILATSRTINGVNFNGSTNITVTAAGSTLSDTVTVAKGGTGQTSYTNGQLLIGNSTGNTLDKASLTGTANQVVVTGGGGSITLSLPQSIATSSSPEFAGVNVGNANDTTITRASAGVIAIEGVTLKPEGQWVIATSNTSSSTATAMPSDDTIPQSGEGVEYITATITPVSATSTLVIEFDAWGTISATGTVTVALFQDSTANALQATAITPATVATFILLPFRLRYTMTSGTTSATTFKIRYGPSAGTAYILRDSVGDRYSTATTATLTVHEILP